ncbi:PQQ-binding-like beta-propeller repeat protein [Terriglobus albidus]|uniref:PQQ-binding-like beta-propeller repeat protein n=1 Tax=Terriglobus albidus TaxID=1592106 RepID=A0A5B9ECE3_9BACT|nr:PQQ-binding-like beta-propeller repeat protein [Terriglobus albidus]QEE29429.1 PQQ-binding-like beta-propeller repeat protein [Terriglobus albidus]
MLSEMKTASFAAPAASMLLTAVVSLAQLSPAAPNAANDLIHPQGTNLGIYVFSARCAGCHDSHRAGIPDRYELNRFTAEDIFKSISEGSMTQYAADLTEIQKRVMAVYVAGRPFASSPAGDATQMPNRCKVSTAAKDSSSTEWNGWGADGTNARYQQKTSISPQNVARLKLKWAFGFPNGNSAYTQPTVVGGRVFVSSDTGYVYAIAAKSGCVFWSFRANAGVRTAIVIGPGKGTGAKEVAYFGDIKGNIYAVDALSGRKLWIMRTDTHPLARITGAPVLYRGTLFVPISSLEESGGGNANYPCCTFRGSLAAYQATTGKLIWKSYTIQDEPHPVRKTSIGTQLWAPAGAGLWSSPTLDLKRNAIYVATGNGYTEPAAHETDAILAFDMRTGKRLWAHQMLANDHYVRDCPGKYRPNVSLTQRSETCPDSLGPDVDFGNSPILRTLPDGRPLIVVGQKDGNAWALDPEKQGELVWNRQLTASFENGGGGMQWGSAADREHAYFPVTRGGGKFGMAAVKLATGEVIWRADPPLGAQAPATVIPGIVFSGSSSGALHAYSAATGQSLWSYDTNRVFDTVNQVEAKGGGMGGASGPVVVGGMLFVTSGSADLFGGPQRGNVLLAFELAE